MGEDLSELLWYMLGLSIFFGLLGSLLTLFFVSRHMKKIIDSSTDQE